MVRNGETVIDPGYVTNLITDDALQFLSVHGPGREPFYLSVHYTAPHSPWTGHPQDIVDSYDECAFESCPQEPRHPWAISLTDQCLGDREMLKGYFAAVTAMDADVGRILDKLDELGISENTLVIFTSDNGFSCGHHGFWGKGNGTWPLNMYENSIKVPFIASHPGVIPEGAVESALVSACDFMPTLLDYLELPLPKGGNLPGQSFNGLLRQDGRPRARERGDLRRVRLHANDPYSRLEIRPSLSGRSERALRSEKRSRRTPQPCRRIRASGAGGGDERAARGMV